MEGKCRPLGCRDRVLPWATAGGVTKIKSCNYIVYVQFAQISVQFSSDGIMTQASLTTHIPAPTRSKIHFLVKKRHRKLPLEGAVRLFTNAASQKQTILPCIHFKKPDTATPWLLRQAWEKPRDY